MNFKADVLKRQEGGQWRAPNKKAGLPEQNGQAGD